MDIGEKIKQLRGSVEKAWVNSAVKDLADAPNGAGNFLSREIGNVWLNQAKKAFKEGMKNIPESNVDRFVSALKKPASLTSGEKTPDSSVSKSSRSGRSD